MRAFSAFMGSAALGALIVPAAVRAEEAAPQAAAESEATGGVGDIVVTARRRSESIQNVPLSVTGISNETLTRQNITTIERLDGLAPSLSIRTAPGPTTSGILINIRGIGGSDATGPSDYPIANYVDGVLIARPNAALFDLIDLERVEVLRGPQGTLFGRNTTGGALNITTRGPSPDFALEQKLTYGTYNLFKARTTIDTGVIGDSGISIKAAYSHIGQGGYIKNTIHTNSDDPGVKRSDAGYLAIHGDFDKFTIDLRGDYMQSHNAPVLQTLAYMTPAKFAYFSQSQALGGDPLVISTDKPSQVAAANQPRGRNKQYGGSATLAYEVSPALTLKSITGYRRFNESQAVNNEAQGNLRGRLANGTVAQVYLFDYPTPAVAKDRTFTEELQAAGDLGNINYVIGGYYFDEKYSSNTTQNFTFVLSPTSALNFVNVRDYTQTSRSYAGFGQVSYKPAAIDGLELTGGLRYTHDRKTLRQANLSNGAALAPGYGERSWSNVSWTGTVNYRTSPDFMAYGRVATAYRAGGFDAGGAGNPVSFNPEKVTSYEVGFKSDLLDRRLRINGSAYLTDYSDLQISQFLAGTGGGRTQTVNAGKARFTGFELELTAAPTDNLTFSGSLGYVHSKYKTYLYLDPATNLVINVADEVHNSHVPDWSGNVGVDWLAARLDNDAKLRLNASFAFQSSTWNFPLDRVNPFNPLIRANAQHNLGARITLEDMPLGDRVHLTIQAYGENLLDQDQRINSVDFGSLGFATLAWGEGRRFGITLTAKYQ